jgi:hypothetical protein
MTGILGHRGLLLQPSGGPGPGPGYSPALWLDASDLTTLFQDSAGTIPVTTDGDPVGRWNDKSGNGRNFTQSSSSQRPTYRTSGGYHWVEFDGSDDWMFGSSNMLAFPTVAAFLAWRQESGTSDFGVVISQPHTSSHSAPYYRWSVQTRTSSGFNLCIISDAVQLYYGPAGANPGNDLVLSFGYSSMWSSTSSAQHHNIMRINGAIDQNGSAGTQTVTYPSSAVTTLGAQVNGGGDRFKGRIYGALVADVAITTQAQIDAWESYLAALQP